MGYCKFKRLIKPIEKQRYMLTWRYYLRHPLKFWKDISRNFRDRIMRAKYGFAPIDMWNMDWYLCALISKMCIALAANCDGYNDMVFDSMSDYQCWLQLLSKIFALNTIDEFDSKTLELRIYQLQQFDVCKYGAADCLFDDIKAIIENDELDIRMKQSRLIELGFDQIGEYYYVLWD